MMAWLAGIADWIAEHATVISAIISAIATGVVAWFTIKLTAATAGLRDVADQQQRDTAAALKLTRDSLALARDEFNATHRPKLIVQSVQFVNVVVPADQSETISAWVRLANTGETAATDFRVHGFITRQKLPLDNGIPIPTQKSDVTELESSERTFVLLPSEFLVSKEQVIQDAFTGANAYGPLFCMGTINYADGSGGRRETGWCRQYDATKRRWLETNNPEYEYAY
jgi:hypothetical protein